MNFPEKLKKKIEHRKENEALRQLTFSSGLIDFSSNDYLGFSKSEYIFERVQELVQANDSKANGATGSRLLSGNTKFCEVLELEIAEFHQEEAALIFNSGYDANLGLLSTIPQRGDIVLYDEYIHASVRDGMQLSNAKSYKFKHNNLGDLEQRLLNVDKEGSSKEVYVVTEAVFSMDGDAPDLEKMIVVCKKHNARLIIDEAHSLGVYGKGIVANLKLQKDVFATVVTFGKALGCHGAAILGSADLRMYLINFTRSFIYTTALPMHSLATIKGSYELLRQQDGQHDLITNISFFKNEIKRLGLNNKFVESSAAIQCCVIGGNKRVKTISRNLKKDGFDVKPILAPTVAEGEERLRFCLHSYNTSTEIAKVLQLLLIHLKNTNK